MKKNQLNKRFFNFIKESPTAFHATHYMANEFEEAGFRRLFEHERWKLKKGISYFIIREDGALTAFSLDGRKTFEDGFRMLGAHTDSPCLQVKPNPGRTQSSFHQLGVEVYGGALLHPWFDRDLSLAGRVCCRLKDGRLQTFLIDFKRPLLVIPSLAIHLDREANKKSSLNAQLHLPPILSQETSKDFPEFTTLLLDEVQRKYPDIVAHEVLGFDMFCYDVQGPSFLGFANEFICSSRLDNLLSCFVGMTAMLSSRSQTNRILICNNHEEIGSSSTSGAMGSFLNSTLDRIIPDIHTNRICVNNSFLISMDNAHSMHPNHSEKSEPDHKVLLNHGPVIKLNANQRYATNSYSRAVYKMVAQEVDVATQDFVMRSDMACGSTIGPLTATKLGVRTIDVGAPSLAMHSIRETTGSDDPYYLYKTIHHFLNRDSLPGE